MKKLTICFLTSFAGGLGTFKSGHYKSILFNLSKKFGKIYIINSDNLIFTLKKKNYSKFKNIGNNFKLINPLNYKDLNNFFVKKRIIIINNIGRNFPVYKLLFYLRIKKNP